MATRGHPQCRHLPDHQNGGRCQSPRCVRNGWHRGRKRLAGNRPRSPPSLRSRPLGCGGWRGLAETAEYFETLKTTIVPNRNSIFLSIAIGYAVSIAANYVFFGAHHSDRGVYPDCRREFVEAFEHAERLANDNLLLVIAAPFVNMSKSEIVKLGVELGVPYKETWSCYKGGRIHCGVCSSCRERKRAFQEAGVVDPTEYAK